jgi:UDP-glucose 4-epimerase
MARFLVTGGAGFIGSNLVRRILEDGNEARVLDNLSTGRRENLEEVEAAVDLVVGDLRDPETVTRAVAGVDYVLHQGALPSVQRSVEDPRTTHEVNSVGTLNVLIAARDAGVKRVVFAGSSSVYGDGEELPKHEGMLPAPISGYAISKIEGEYQCRVFHHLYGLETVTLRYFNVFGPRQDPSSQYSAVIPRFITALLSDTAPTIYGDGTQARDFSYIDNVVEANMLACTAPGAPGHAMNIACGAMASLLELAALLRGITGVDIEPAHEAPRSGDVRYSLAAIEKAKELLGYEPLVDLRDGLVKTTEFFAGAASPR